MFASTFAPQLSLQESSRVPALSREAGISVAEFACLLTCGALAAMAIGLLHLSLRVPGHAILRGVLPMTLGLALVPRRWAGTVMAIGAGITAVAMSAVHIGRFPAPAMLSVLALGPVLDVALLGQPTGWRLYARFVIAGAVANLLAYAFKVAGVQLGIEMFSGGGREFMRLALHTVIASYILCGAVAGFLGAAACFRGRGGDDLRRN
jgi:hypothetical protein